MEHLLNQCVQGNTLKTSLVKQISHQTRQHETAPEFHHVLMECCFYEIRMLSSSENVISSSVNDMCISLVCLYTESRRIVSCVGINLCL